MLDFGLGFQLMRDRRVSLGTKGLALMLGAAVIAALVAMELPVEAMVGAVLNVIGFGLDFLVDGFEFLIGPLLVAALFLTRLAPVDLVARLRAERYGPPAIDVEAH